MSTKQLLMKVSSEVAKKFKINAAVSGMTMTELFVKFVNTLETPEFLDKKEKQSIKQTTSRTSKISEPDFKLVDIKSIEVDSVAAERITKKIKDLADSITKIGLIKPLLLLQTGVESYLLLSSESEFQAVKRANQLNPQKCEMVNAMVVSKSALNETLRQKDILNKM